MKPDFEKIKNIQACEWIDQKNLAQLIQNMDIAITRGSATTLAELTSFREKSTPLIIIPLPWSAGNHQYHNALWYKENRNDIILEEEEISQL
jgi:UDP-N-acetylglucosamine--N-acetylmuramyl-(pentapeptide) pyrophosphoryl-undecaprenol N-acetylglucosamine transferase